MTDSKPSTIFRFLSSTLFALLLLTPLKGNTMASLNPFKACTFSAMEIRLTLNGEPASGAMVTRTVTWKTKIVDTFTATGDGKVYLPSMHESSITQILPVEFISSQVISVEYKGEDYTIWVYAKRNPETNFEFSGKPIRASCELSDKPVSRRTFNTIIKTSCELD